MSKPVSGTTVNVSQAISASLIAAWPMLEGSGSTSADATGNGHGLAFGAGESWGTLGSDIAILCSGADAAPLTVSSPLNLITSQPWSVAWRAIQTASGNAGMLCGDNTATTTFIWFQGGVALTPRLNNGTTNFNAKTFTSAHNYVLTWDPANTRLRLYVDGVEDSLSPLTVSAINGALVINQLGNGYTSNTLSLAGAITYFYAWSNRVLAPTDSVSLNTDPYLPLRSSGPTPFTPAIFGARQAINRAATY